MPASQLSQLKAALSTSGINRSKSKKDKKGFKKGGPQDTDRAKKLQKLEDIRKGLNKFDERETRVKHDVGGRNLKGVTGRPSASKQAGLEQRRKSLLPEHQLRGHTGTFQDRRFGEADPTMSLEDRMLERYTRERQRGGGKKGMFNIEDEDDLDPFGGEDGFALGGLTHGGRNVSDLKGDDFEMQGLGEDEEERGHIDMRTVRRAHFGGFGEEEENEQDMPERKKSKAEVMSEIIAKSKDHKYERQQQRELDANLRDELDGDLDDLRSMLLESAPGRTGSNMVPLGGPSKHSGAEPPKPDNDTLDADYDQFVRTLAFDARAKPTDRTKTEEEQAIEEKERLEKAEATRLRRMRGEDVSDDEGGASRKRKKAADRKADADDLDDDFDGDMDEDGAVGMFGKGITREEIEEMGRMKGGDSEDDEDDEDEDEDGDDDEGEDEDSEDDEDEDEDDDDEDDASDMEDLQENDQSDGEDAQDVVPKSKKRANGKAKEIPYTFSCPTSIEDFEDILEDLEDAALPTVVQRIRALHHPSLAAGNKEKLQAFLGVLLDYTLILAARPDPPFDLITSLTQHVIPLVKMNPITAAGHFIAKLTLMQKNLGRGLARGASREDSKTFPGCPELVLLRLIGVIWSTSDFSHPVVAPAMLLSCQYLGQSRIRSISDIASGLFLCSILAQYEGFSKRIVPEAINFVASALSALLPRRKGLESSADAFPDLKGNTDLYFSSPTEPEEPADLPALVNGAERPADVIAIAFRLVSTCATLYSSTPAYMELFDPILSLLQGSRVAKLSPKLKTLHVETIATLTRMLGFARASRQPLALQAHKPIPIASYAPKFEENYSITKHYDPDAERNSASKLKALYKKEKKGAIRELRKDNKFLAGEKAREQSVKDADYKAKMRKVEGGLNMERAEEKAMEREKNRDKRRAGRK